MAKYYKRKCKVIINQREGENEQKYKENIYNFNISNRMPGRRDIYAKKCSSNEADCREDESEKSDTGCRVVG